jgi:hypothetical protein
MTKTMETDRARIFLFEAKRRARKRPNGSKTRQEDEELEKGRKN